MQKGQSNFKESMITRREVLNTRVASIVDNWISVPSWYTMIRAIGLKPGQPLQRLAEREWYSSR